MSLFDRVVVCTGGRDYHNREVVRAAILASSVQPLVIVGDATGADQAVRFVCHEVGIPLMVVPALWDTEGKPAGPRRNGRMIEVAKALGGRTLIAFPGGRGTADCVRKARAAGLEVIEVQP